MGCRGKVMQENRTGMKAWGQESTRFTENCRWFHVAEASVIGTKREEFVGEAAGRLHGLVGFTKTCGLQHLKECLADDVENGSEGKH